MIKRGWLTPLLVSIICIVILLSYQSKQFGESLASHSNLPQIPWEKEVSEIAELTIVSGSQTISIIQKDNLWKMTSPVSSNVDAAYLYDALSFIVKPPILSTVASPVEDLKSFGIDAYSKSVSFTDNEGKKYELICGSAVDQTSYYALEPLSHTIYTIDKNAFDKLSSSVDDWRERQYIDFNPDKIQTIKIQLGDKVHTISQSIISNKPTFSSSTLPTDTVDQLIRFLKTSRVDKFIVDGASPDIITSYGFDTPSLTFILIGTDGSKQIFDLNKVTPSTQTSYIMDRQSNNIYTIPSFSFSKN